MKVGDLVYISIHSPLYSYVGGVGTIVRFAGSRRGVPFWRVFIDGSLSPYYFSKKELDLVKEA